MDIINNLRNVAIIAHVDHGKTTLVDQLLKQSGTFRNNEVVMERIMDSNALERERGITILSKNTSIIYKDTKINIVDTPGHSDFSGEVERILMMVDGVLLLVDAFEGCMPQTKFVLKKALSLNKTPLVVVNKVDRDGARPLQVVDEIIDLFIDLGANEDQLDFPVVFTSAKYGYASLEASKKNENMLPLLDTILQKIPPPKGTINAPLQILFSNIDYDEYVGRIGIGRVERGQIHKGDTVVLSSDEQKQTTFRISKLYQFEGLKRVETNFASLGDIIAVSGIDDIKIGDTVCSPDCIEPIKFVQIDQPTISMLFMVNDSPFAGQEGKFVTSRNLRERLFKELQTNVAMKVEDTESADTFRVSGRGELHLSILIETMRRQNYEFQVSKPNVIYKNINGRLCEPFELLMIEVPDNYVGVVMEKLGQRKAQLIDMSTRNSGVTHLEFNIPSRSLMGYQTEFLSDTNGNGILNHVFSEYQPVLGYINLRNQGSLIAFETGVSTSYGLFAAQERGAMFIGPSTPVYEGMVVGVSSNSRDIVVNVCKKKHVTNMRAAGTDEALRLVPKIDLSLEQALEFIADDEIVEVTPKSIRLRKKILNKEKRLKHLKKS